MTGRVSEKYLPTRYVFVSATTKLSSHLTTKSLHHITEQENEECGTGEPAVITKGTILESPFMKIEWNSSRKETRKSSRNRERSSL